jgi:hypothetical protein
MKKSLFVFLICLGAASICTAGQGSVPVLVSAPDSKTVQLLDGSIVSLAVPDAARGLGSEIVVADQKGLQHVLIVKATTTIYDTAWKPTGFDVLRKNDRVKVKYITTGEGLTEALSIKQLH